MPTKSTTTDPAVADVQAKVLDAIKATQDASLDAVHEWAEAVAAVLPVIPEWTDTVTSLFPPAPEWAEPIVSAIPDMRAVWPIPTFEDMVDFSVKLFDRQREFTVKLFDAVSPLTDTGARAAKSTAKAARQAPATHTTTNANSTVKA